MTTVLDRSDVASVPPAAAAGPVVAAAACAVVGAVASASVAVGRPVGPAVLGLYLLVPGVLLLSLRPAAASRYALLVPAVGLATTIACGSLALWLGLWAPGLLTVLAGAAVVVVSVRTVLRRRSTLIGWGGGRRRLLRGPVRPSRTTSAVAVCLAVALAAWVVAVLGALDADARAGGLLAVVGWPFGIAVAAGLVGFGLALRAGRTGLASLAALVLLVVVRGTGTLASSVPVYHWTYKHLGVVDLMQSRGSVLGGLDVYQAWPGFFAGAAWLSDASGIAAIDLARWTTPALELALGLAVAALARALGGSRDVAVAAGLVAVVVNWVGQDYFAPQAVAIVLATAVLALVVDREAPRSAAWAALGLYAALVVSHQLTPYWVLGATLLLTLVLRRRWWLPAAMAALALGYLALHYDAVAHYGIFSGFGDAVQNARTTIGVDPSDQQRLDSTVARAAALAVWGSAAAVLAVAALRRREGWVITAIVAFSPFALLLAQSYGGEAVLRVMLFTVPGCAVAIAGAVVALLRASWVRFTAGVVWLGLLAAVCAQATYDSWFLDRVSEAEVRTSRLLLDEVPGDAYLSAAVPRWPDRATGAYAWRLEDQWDFDRSAYAIEAADLDFTSVVDAVLLERSIRSSAALPTYLIFSDAMDAYADYYGLYPPGTLDRMRDLLVTRSGWDVVLAEDGVLVLRYLPGGLTDTPAATWRAR
ncbi:hypothetical protein CLV56_2576 [Mumia flava]|uniref:Uncharacterized protein n=1 Tax=Mumia flava TaxID=1348852 RepID=A0A2M9BK59_9ACTN|nr:hypothetical protein [Mumia flava]PJJ58325.1 hypothetical protein CLV56_2576 [Mumia flava]